LSNIQRSVLQLWHTSDQKENHKTDDNCSSCDQHDFILCRLDLTPFQWRVHWYSECENIDQVYWKPYCAKSPENQEMRVVVKLEVVTWVFSSFHTYVSFFSEEKVPETRAKDPFWPVKTSVRSLSNWWLFVGRGSCAMDH
jgi:hypothetical protein